MQGRFAAPLDCSGEVFSKPPRVRHGRRACPGDRDCWPRLTRSTGPSRRRPRTPHREHGATDRARQPCSARNAIPRGPPTFDQRDPRDAIWRSGDAREQPVLPAARCDRVTPPTPGAPLRGLRARVWGPCVNADFSRCQMGSASASSWTPRTSTGLTVIRSAPNAKSKPTTSPFEPILRFFGNKPNRQALRVDDVRSRLQVPQRAEAVEPEHAAERFVFRLRAAVRVRHVERSGAHGLGTRKQPVATSASLTLPSVAKATLS